MDVKNKSNSQGFVYSGDKGRDALVGSKCGFEEPKII